MFIKVGTIGIFADVVHVIALSLFAGTSVTLSLANVFIGLRNTPLAFIAESSAWAAAFAAELAIINNFIFNNIWTFKEKKITGFFAIIKKFLAFNLSTVGAIVIQFIVIGIMVLVLGDTRLIRQLGILVAMPLVLSYNYVIYNLLLT